METTAAERWLYETLAGDAELTALVSDRIFGYIAPIEAVFPLVVFQVQAGADVRGVGPTRIMSALTMVVRGVDRGQSFVGLEAIADRIDALLQGRSGVGVLGCVRLEPLALAEVVDGIQYRHLGGIYQMYVQ